MPERAVPRRRRAWLGAALVVTVLLGLVTTAVPGHGSLTGPAGDALYAVMAWLVVAMVAPRVDASVITLTSLALCWTVEAAQATGVPARVVEAVPAGHLLLGTTFAATDLLWYAAGCAAAWGVDRAVVRRR